MAIMEILVTAADQASGVLKNVGATGSRAGGTLAANWGKVAIAGAAAGAAVEGMARKVAPLNKTMRNLADSTDMTEKEIRGMAASLVDATFPADEVVALLERGRQQGLQTADQLQDFAKTWDMVGDATGESSDKLAQSSVALRALGVDAENPRAALAALGYVTESTTMEAGEFMRVVGRIAPELSELGLGINETAGLLGVMESKGYDSRTAMREIRQAVSSADGDMDEFRATLGITSEEMAEYTAKVEESGDVIERRAQREAESKTVLQGLMAVVDRAKISMGGYLQTVANLAPALMALGPAIKAISVAKGIWTAVQSKLNIALLANPIGIVIALVAALAAGVYLVIKNWDTVGPWFADLWDWVKDIFTAAWEWIKEMFLNYTPQGLIIKHWEPITDFFRGLWAGVVEVFQSAWNRIKAIVERVTAAVRRVREAASGARKAASGAASRAVSAVVDAVPSFHDGGIYRAPTPGGEGLALLRDGERITTPEQAGRDQGGPQITIDQRGLFDGANIRMTSKGDAERLSEQLFGLTRSRLRAVGVTI